MTDALVKHKMNQIAKLCDELHAEAKRRYGKDGLLFFECEGYFNLMDGDSLHGRQKHVKIKSDYGCSLQCGAW